MIIEEVLYEKYAAMVKPDFVYDSVQFHELNKYKMDHIKYLLFKDKKYRFGLCIGIREGEVLCPFSAPFGTMVAIRKPVPIEYVDEALEVLEAYVIQNGFKSIRFILPPMIYQETEISIFVNALYRKGYAISNIDLNFQFDLRKVFIDQYSELLPHNGRKNLRIGLDSELVLKHCETEKEIRDAYQVIAENREAKGYPLRMSFQQVLDTIQLVHYDVFLVMKNDICIAAALIYYVNDKVAQVIYWGDRPGYGEYKPINYLAYQLIRYYGSKGLDYLDIGPSTENSIPNYGLCDFKASIGCDISSKFAMKKILA